MSSTISPGMHPVLCALRVIDAGLDELAEGNLWSLLDSEALEVRVELERLASRLHAERLRSTREVETRGAAIRAGAPNTRTWLINKVHLHPGEAGRELTLAGQLDTDLPATAAALAAGAITPAAAAVIAESDAQLRKVATAAQRADAEAFLAEQAAVFNVRHLTNLAIHLRNRLDPDQGERLAEEEEAQVELALRSGDLPTQAGQPVQLVVTIGLADLESRLTRALNCDGPGAGAFHRSPTRDDGQRTDQSLFPDVFARFGAYQGTGTGAGVGAGVGLLDSGLPVSAATVRRWACDCQLIPIVLGAHGEPLDAGRASREPTPAIRRALDVRDRGCAFPGCDRPTKWCISHHIVHWEALGETSCANLVLLCGHHHRVIHHHGWDVHIAPDGLPTFYPPAWIDPDRQPRRHLRYPPHPTATTSPPPPAHAPIIPFPRRT